MTAHGVPFATAASVRLHRTNLARQLQGISLLLNGLAGLAFAFGFRCSIRISWPKAGSLGMVVALGHVT